ncbi:hypothetical protein A2962_03600 [Candidatus Woesebacteria bacterium RIFCSPLOWO2_01_FULL_39_61]|uniref:Uncharacterized protein n=1 Tax=Candidatus Woesebacteria bacterium RIFCSPHIGHO2_02_FULL_39_13 TaxID=1802505 RepID=A0A1F7Z1F9_9BACT|nr:MAG: hypothetical protein A2692_04055 [Candidatus Woesebacteria bacterium RIFCSPHIGHO2_01_FULL_39_95]OGM32545.1 MAG: hypothetical protein A3D01_01805 [Candidatus Woesebacteria bacterium RIFCSPHIGHO2_02_FULL_39_13]OGM37517.1 MAG: hypothetical protein A3E13_02700 [Candidatus Woesebacteria bacterium RIFCSPHIGHO2_12_FULL_40_20]OGM68189.1 MAG: hypothetical protein A2962_03600 [Candidatus Woesebacteria bacterium RIFCSPLOWO2_01_FULL_39_61]
MDKLLEKIEKYILYAVIFLLPIAFFGISPNPFVVPKLAILTFGICLILLVRSVRIISDGKLDFSVGTFDFPVALLAAAYIVSAILRTPNKMEAFLLPGTATALVGGAFLYFLTNQLKDSDKKTLSTLLFGSAVFFSLFSLLAFSGIFSKIPQLPAYVRAQGFTPEGGFLPGVIFLITVLPLGVGLLLSEKQKSTKALFAVAVGVTAFALAIAIYSILPGRPSSPRFPSLNNSWQISVDALKESPIFGVGPGNYLTAFNRFRPLTYNRTDLWPVKFATANNFYLTLMTEVGLLGLAAIILLLISVYKTVRKEAKEQKLVNWGFAGIANLVSLAILIILMAIFPATVFITVLLFIYLSLSTKVKHTSLNLTTQGPAETTQSFAAREVASRFPSILITLPVIIAVILISIRGSRILLAEQKFNSALNFLIKNDAAKTYDTLREAIRLNPYVDRYHATSARVNLALANAIAQRATTAQKPTDQGAAPQPTVSDQDRQNITLLVQQAIAEGKATVALNPLRSGNWEILGQIYRAIMPLAQGADAFAVQTYRQAVALDPFNPNIRIALGGVFYSRGDYDNAIRSFESAVAAKGDHANAHYNLAYAYRDAGNTDRAIQELSLVLSLITDKNSQDYEVAKKALEDLQAKKRSEVAEGEELTPAQGEQSPEIKPPIELPEGTEPPEAPVTPTPSPTPDVSVTPELTPTPAP